MRRLAGAVIGTLVTLLIAYIAAVVVVLATIGIPLGAEARPLTRVQSVLLLGGCTLAAMAGGRVAKRVGRHTRSADIWALCVVLAALMMWGFSGRNAYPDWWGPAVAATMVVGAGIGGRVRRA